ncbi:MAG TPA: cation diffusion facilitator family transporter, partial [Trueperaceae bacterium]|nr:cation diffusion facilitator family transporter [Trueperaceae bacterium]
IADAGHNASDVLSLVAAWGGQRLSKRPATAGFSYGLPRAPILGSLFNALLLFGAMGAVTFEAIQRLAHPNALPGMPIVYVTIVGLVVNFGTALLFVRGREDLNVRAAFVHMMADGASTAGVLIAGLIIHFTGAGWVDPAVSLAIVVLVLWSTWGLFTQSVRMLVDAVPQGIDLAAVRAALVALPGVTSVHDVHVWPLSTRQVAASAHLVLERPVSEPNALLHDACSCLHDRFAIGHATLQVEYGRPVDPCGLLETHELLEDRAEGGSRGGGRGGGKRQPQDVAS